MATDVLTRAQVLDLIACTGTGRTAPRNRALLVTLWRTGLRLDEALSLLPSDVDAASGRVHVKRGKGNKARTVPIDRLALDVIQDYAGLRRSSFTLRRGSPLFCTLDGGKLKPQYVQQLVSRLAERADLGKHVHPHMFRATYACELMREGSVNVSELQRLLGHSNLAVTTAYLQKVSTPEEVVKKIHARPSWEDERARARAVAMHRSVTGRKKPSDRKVIR